MTQPRLFNITSSKSKHPCEVISWMVSMSRENPMPVTTVFLILFQSVTHGSRKPKGMNRIIFPRKFAPILPLWISFMKEINAWSGRYVIGVPIKASRLNIVIHRIRATVTPSSAVDISFLLLIADYIGFNCHLCNSIDSAHDKDFLRIHRPEHIDPFIHIFKCISRNYKIYHLIVRKPFLPFPPAVIESPKKAISAS